MKYFLLTFWEVKSKAGKARVRLGGKELEDGLGSMYIHTRSF